MTREEAIDIIRKNIPHLGIDADKMTDALEELIPELRESEDDRMINAIILFTKDSEFEGIVYRGVKIPKDQMIAHLEKLKENTTVEPKQGWSEEDEDKVAKYLHDRDGGMLWSKATEITSDILDMLCPRPSWKPGEEQMEALHDAKNYLIEYCQPNIAKVLSELEEQLEKL